MLAGNTIEEIAGAVYLGVGVACAGLLMASFKAGVMSGKIRKSNTRLPASVNAAIPQRTQACRESPKGVADEAFVFCSGPVPIVC